MILIIGANLNIDVGLKPNFNHPSANRLVHVLLDAPHMLKLFRNMLHQYGGLKLSGVETPARLENFQQLVNLQSTIGASAANKLSSKHVN